MRLGYKDTISIIDAFNKDRYDQSTQEVTQHTFDVWLKGRHKISRTQRVKLSEVYCETKMLSELQKMKWEHDGQKQQHELNLKEIKASRLEGRQSKHTEGVEERNPIVIEDDNDVAPVVLAQLTAVANQHAKFTKAKPAVVVTQPKMGRGKPAITLLEPLRDLVDFDKQARAGKPRAIKAKPTVSKKKATASKPPMDQTPESQARISV